MCRRRWSSGAPRRWSRRCSTGSARAGRRPAARTRCAPSCAASSARAPASRSRPACCSKPSRPRSIWRSDDAELDAAHRSPGGGRRQGARARACTLSGRRRARQLAQPAAAGTGHRVGRASAPRLRTWNGHRALLGCRETASIRAGEAPRHESDSDRHRADGSWRARLRHLLPSAEGPDRFPRVADHRRGLQPHHRPAAVPRVRGSRARHPLLHQLARRLGDRRVGHLRHHAIHPPRGLDAVPRSGGEHGGMAARRRVRAASATRCRTRA